jgi:hypothetical protein
LRFSIPSKIFLLGEYSVLEGAPALLATLRPRFHIESSENAVSPAPTLSEREGAPATRLQAWALKRGLKLPETKFFDAFGGQGGFGGSTAEFALQCAAIHAFNGLSVPSWDAGWRLYRELLRKEGVPGPSGADLVAQWCGGLVSFDPSVTEIEWFDLSQRAASGVLTFSATHLPGTKTPTHLHLEALSESPSNPLKDSSELRDITEGGLAALRAEDLAGFGASLSRYGRALKLMGLEVQQTTEFRDAIGRMPGVLGVKGAGARQSDAIVVVVDPLRDDFEVCATAAIQKAQGMGLRLVQRGILREKGLINDEISGPSTGEHRAGQVHGQAGFLA